MRKNSFFAALAMLCLSTTSLAQQFNFDASYTDLYKAGDANVHTYRIPAIIQSKDGTILAFAEARQGTASDTGDINMVVRRSKDGGKTWGDIITIWDDGKNVCGNPAPVVDQRTGRIVLLMTWNKGSDHEPDIFNRTSEDTRRVYMTYSDDDGLSWATPVEITQTAKLSEWTWYATGPCHGIQLQKGPHKGRLVISGNHGFDKPNGQCNGNSSHLIISDDGGKTWRLGAGEDNELEKGNESTVAQLKNGDLMLNMRNAYVDNYQAQGSARRVAISHDAGESFAAADIYHDRMLLEPICQGSLLNYTPKGKLTDVLLFSNPASTVRRNMTVKKSQDSGQSWSVVFQDSHSHAAYSDLVSLQNGDVALLYETGKKNAYEAIRFVVIPKERIQQK